MKQGLIVLALGIVAFLGGRYLGSQQHAGPIAEPTPVASTTGEERPAPTRNLPTLPTRDLRSTPEDVQGQYTPQELHTIRLFERASPSVCYISTLRLQRDFFSFDVSEVPSGTGSGFIWDEEGHIITNYHVIRGASKALVTLSTGSSYEAKLVGIAPEKDLAVLKVDVSMDDVVQIPLGSSYDLRVGQSVYAIGNPFGLDQTLTTGIISALDREINSQAGVPIQGAVQTDAAINPGNSGGPLLDSRGLLIGVNTAIYSPSGASAGIGFSIPVDEVKLVVPDLIAYGQVRRPTLGVEEYRPYRRRVEGVIIKNVEDAGAAAESGLRGIRRDQYGNYLMGDVIKRIGGEPVNSMADIYLELENYEPNDMVVVEFEREGRLYEAEVKLGSSVND
ncbi:MAG: trypsin-like peptidase domain-containing protein [Bacteroidota bacterium]